MPLFLTRSLEISWKPDHKESQMVGRQHVVAALAELEIALGKPVSFEAELTNLSTLAEQFKASGLDCEVSSEPFFTWDPPLPRTGDA